MADTRGWQGLEPLEPRLLLSTTVVDYPPFPSDAGGFFHSEEIVDSGLLHDAASAADIERQEDFLGIRTITADKLANWSDGEIHSESMLTIPFRPTEDGLYQIDAHITGETQFVSVFGGALNILHKSQATVELSYGVRRVADGAILASTYPVTLYETDPWAFYDSYYQSQLTADTANELISQGIAAAVGGHLGGAFSLAYSYATSWETSDEVETDSHSMSLTTTAWALEADTWYEWFMTVDTTLESEVYGLAGSIQYNEVGTELRLDNFEISAPDAPPPPPTPEPDAQISDSQGNAADRSIDYGTIHLGEARPESVYVRNTGTDVLTLEDWSLGGDGFSVVSAPSYQTDLQPGEGTEFRIRFDPSEIGSASGTLVINSNDPDTPTSSITLTGVATNAAPQAHVVALSDPWVGRELQFVASASDPDGDSITQWEWDNALRVSGDGSELSLTFDKPGDYSVRVRARDELGAWSDWATTTVTVRKQQINAVVVGQRNLDDPLHQTALHLNAKAIGDSVVGMGGELTYIEIDYLGGYWWVNGELGASASVSDEIVNAVDQAMAGLTEGDLFMFVYVGKTDVMEGDGGESPIDVTLENGSLSAANTGDEYLSLLPSESLLDDDLASLLGNYGDTVKLVSISGSYADGFWGDPTNSSDQDLSGLSNTVFLSASPESQAELLSPDSTILPGHVIDESQHAKTLAAALRPSPRWTGADMNVDGLTITEVINAVSSSTPDSSGHASADLLSGDRLIHSPASRAMVTGRVWHDADGGGQIGSDEAGVPGQFVYVDYDHNGQHDVPPIQTTHAADVPVTIEYRAYDGQTIVTQWTTSTQLDVSGARIIDAADITFDIDFDWFGFLAAYLTSPEGTTATLFYGPLIGSSYATTMRLAEFDGEDPNGTWTLSMTNHSPWSGYVIEGTLNSWSLGMVQESEPSSVTDEFGNYALQGILPGNREIRTAIADTDLSTPLEGYHAASLSPGTYESPLDFGKRSDVNRIEGRVWLDGDFNDSFGPNDSLLKGHLVFMDEDGDGVWDSSERMTSTDAQGYYAFSAVPDGSHNVAIDLPDGWYQIAPTAAGSEVQVVGGQSTTVDFSLTNDPPSAQLSGLMWVDKNGDGDRDSDEPGMAGVVAYLDDNNNLELDWTDLNGNQVWDNGEGEQWVRSQADDPLTTGVDETGCYVFADVPIGDHVVRQVTPLGYRVTSPPGVTWNKTPAPELTEADIAALGALGDSVSIDGIRAVVGLSYKGAGAAYIYEWDGDQWVQQATLLASDGQTFDYFGYSVSIDGDQVMVGAPSAGSNAEGAVYIFQWDGNQWMQQTRLANPGYRAESAFGGAVSISGEYAVVGSRSAGTHIYKREDSGWTIQSTHIPQSYKVSIEGSLIMTQGANDLTYLFERDGEDWRQLDTIEGEVVGFGFGHELTVAPADDFTGLDFGAIRGNIHKPDLAAEADTGVSQTDNLTNHNVGSSDRRLTFAVRDVLPDDTVRLIATNNLTGQRRVLSTGIFGPGLVGTFEIGAGVDGYVPLSDGTYEISFEVLDAYGTWDSKGSLRIIIDTTAPVVAVDPMLTSNDVPTVTGTIDDPTADLNVEIDGINYAVIRTAPNSWAAQVDQSLLPDSYDVRVTAVDLAGNVGTDTTIDELTVVEVPPSLTSSQINPGQSQRSSINTVDLLFSRSVNVSAASLRLLDEQGAIVPLTDATLTTEGNRVAVALQQVQLADGKYVLQILPDGVTDQRGNALDVDGDGLGDAGSSKYASIDFHRLYGDGDGDRQVTARDMLLVRRSFGKSEEQSGFDPNADINGDGIVNALDLAGARISLGHNLLGPPALTVTEGDDHPTDGVLLMGASVLGYTSAQSIVTLHNDGEMSLTIGGLALAGPDAAKFRWDFGEGTTANPGFVLAAGESREIHVYCSPTHDGELSARLQWWHNDPSQPEQFEVGITAPVERARQSFTVNEYEGGPVADRNIDLGPVLFYDPISDWQSVSIENTGNLPVTLSNGRIQYPEFGFRPIEFEFKFDRTPAGATGVTLAPGESETLSVRAVAPFAAPGTYSGQLIIDHNVPGEEPILLSLHIELLAEAQHSWILQSGTYTVTIESDAGNDVGQATFDTATQQWVETNFNHPGGLYRGYADATLAEYASASLFGEGSTDAVAVDLQARATISTFGIASATVETHVSYEFIANGIGTRSYFIEMPSFSATGDVWSTISVSIDNGEGGFYEFDPADHRPDDVFEVSAGQTVRLDVQLHAQADGEYGNSSSGLDLLVYDLEHGYTTPTDGVLYGFEGDVSDPSSGGGGYTSGSFVPDVPPALMPDSTTSLMLNSGESVYMSFDSGFWIEPQSMCGISFWMQPLSSSYKLIVDLGGGYIFNLSEPFPQWYWQYPGGSQAFGRPGLVPGQWYGVELAFANSGETTIRWLDEYGWEIASQTQNISSTPAAFSEGIRVNNRNNPLLIDDFRIWAE
jgi:subtilisin-like proprotein convertase family protein